MDFFFLRIFSALEAFIFDSRQTGRRGKERGRHSVKVTGSGTRTRDGRFEDYSLYMWLHTNPYTTSAAPRTEETFKSLWNLLPVLLGLKTVFSRDDMDVCFLLPPQVAITINLPYEMVVFVDNSILYIILHRSWTKTI
ncbi:hypothetical protein XENORESO_006910 [Xenotaenia resolanae]|uniref:Uncharacterized protein n=1 Tax=Xenotaenia resolanae TaxID=208358 RepID=A0ABV0WMD3_9TELE